MYGYCDTYNNTAIIKLHKIWVLANNTYVRFTLIIIIGSYCEEFFKIVIGFTLYTLVPSFLFTSRRFVAIFTIYRVLLQREESYIT